MIIILNETFRLLNYSKIKRMIFKYSLSYFLKIKNFIKVKSRLKKILNLNYNYFMLFRLVLDFLIKTLRRKYSNRKTF